MDKAHATTAVAARYKRVNVVVIVAPAESAVSLRRVKTNFFFGLWLILLDFSLPLSL